MRFAIHYEGQNGRHGPRLDVLLEEAEVGRPSNDSWTPAAPRSRPASASESSSSSGPTWTPSPSPSRCDVDDDSDFDGPPLPPPPPCPPAPAHGGKKKKMKKRDHGKDKKHKKDKKDKKRRKHGGRKEPRSTEQEEKKRGTSKEGCRGKVEEKACKRKATEIPDDPESPSPLDLLAIEDGAASPSTPLPPLPHADLSPDSQPTVIMPAGAMDNLAATLIEGFSRPLEEDSDDCREAPLCLAWIGVASSTATPSCTTFPSGTSGPPSDTTPLPTMPATGSPLWRITAGFQELSIDSDVD